MNRYYKVICVYLLSGMILLKNLLNESIKLDVDKAYDVFNQSYTKSTGKSWDKDKFLQRASNWTFHGDDNGYVAVRQQNGGLIKLVGVAGSLKSVYKGMKEVQQSYSSRPVWGMMSSDIASQLEKMGDFLVVRVSGGIKTRIFLNVIKKIIPSSVFGGAEIKGINSDGTITFAYNDVGETNKVLVGNKHYMEYLKKQILSNTTIPDFVKNQAVQMLPESIQEDISSLDEKRKFPHLNQKLSIPDTVLKFAERDDTFISFRKLLKTGLNPASRYNTPLGIYMYPAKMALNHYGKSEEHGIRFPFAIDYPFVYFIVKKPNIKELNVESYSRQDSERDMDILIKKYSSLFDEDTLNDLTTSGDTMHEHLAIGNFWYFCLRLSQMLSKSKGGKSPTHWNNILKKDLGYDLVIDPKHGVIHDNEPCQAFFTNDNAFTVYTVIEQKSKSKTINYDKIANNPEILRKFFTGRTVTDKNVTNLISNSSDYLKMVDTLLNINIPLTDNNVATLISYSKDKKSQTVDRILSKDVPLTDNNVDFLLRYSDPNKKQLTIDLLLGKKVPLTTRNISNLFYNSPDKEKIVDFILVGGKEIPLDDLTLDGLLRYSNNKEKVIDFMLSKGVKLLGQYIDSLFQYSFNKEEVIDILLKKGLSINEILSDRNVANILADYSNGHDKQKTIDIFLRRGVPLTDRNIATFMEYSEDRKKIVDTLLNKGIELTDSVIKTIIKNSDSKEQIIDVLSNKGVSIDRLFTDNIIRDVLYYSTDKPKTIDFMLNKGVTIDNILTNDNFYNLIYYKSSDKEQIIDFLAGKNIPMATLTEDNINAFIHSCSNLIQNQKAIALLLSRGVSIDKILTANNIYSIITKSDNWQTAVDFILSKDVPLDDGNVSHLLHYSKDKQKTADILLSRNIPLTSDNVLNLLYYPPEKQKTIDILLSRNVPMTYSNMRNLSYYAPDKQLMQQQIDALKTKQSIDETKLGYRDFYSYLNELD